MSSISFIRANFASTGTLQDCGRPSINWYNGKIIDTGNPQANYFPSAPGQFNRMGQIYANNNVTIINGVTSVVPAQKGIATGQPQSATRCNSQWNGFDYEGGFYYSWNWYMDRPYVSSGFASVCPQNLRLIKAHIKQGSGWKDFMASIDTGTPQAMIGGLVGGGGGAGGTIQMKFDPNPNPIAYNSENRGINYVPAYYISKRLNICITSQYTIAQSQGQGGTLSYNCSSGKITSGDALNGKEWKKQ